MADAVDTKTISSEMKHAIWWPLSPLITEEFDRLIYPIRRARSTKQPDVILGSDTIYPQIQQCQNNFEHWRRNNVEHQCRTSMSKQRSFNVVIWLSTPDLKSTSDRRWFNVVCQLGGWFKVGAVGEVGWGSQHKPPKPHQRAYVQLVKGLPGQKVTGAKGHKDMRPKGQNETRPICELHHHTCVFHHPTPH